MTPGPGFEPRLHRWEAIILLPICFLKYFSSFQQVFFKKTLVELQRNMSIQSPFITRGQFTNQSPKGSKAGNMWPIPNARCKRGNLINPAHTPQNLSYLFDLSGVITYPCIKLHNHKFICLLCCSHSKTSLQKTVSVRVSEPPRVHIRPYVRTLFEGKSRDSAK